MRQRGSERNVDDGFRRHDSGVIAVETSAGRTCLRWDREYGTYRVSVSPWGALSEDRPSRLGGRGV